VIVYCGGGISAAAVARALAITGHEDVAIYDGSLEEWSATLSRRLSSNLNKLLHRST